jgi:hypothetical protein
MPHTLAQALAELETVGIAKNDYVTVDDIAKEIGITPGDPVNMLRLLSFLGSELPRPPCLPISDDIWHFDTECIYQHGDYVKIAQRLMRLSKGKLDLANLQDAVFLDEQAASIHFDFHGQRFDWELKVNGDWVDPSVFSSFADLFASIPSRARFTYGNVGGQSCFIGFSTPEQTKRLTSLTGIPFVRLR